MTARTIANRLLEAEPDDLDASAEIKRLTTSRFPGYDIDVEGSYWNVYKQWQGSQHFIGEIHYIDMNDAPVEIMSPEARAHHEAHRWVSIAGFRDNESQECKTFDQAVQWIIAVNIAKTARPLGRPVAEAVDPDDPELYAHPEKFSQQPSDEKIEGALRRMLAPYYTRVTISKRPGMFANREMTQRNIPDQPGVVNRLPFADSFIWTIHCHRDTPLPLSLVNRALPGYDLDWRQEVKHWFEKWASKANLSLLKFEIYGRLRKDPTFQFETARLGPLKENEDPTPEQIIAHYTATTDWSHDLYADLWRFHPYGVGYEVLDIKRGAYIVAQTYFPPEKDSFALRFKEFVQNWFEQKRIFPVKFVKLYAFKHARGEQWSTIATINVPWADPDLPEYTPPVEPGAGAPVEVGQP